MLPPAPKTAVQRHLQELLRPSHGLPSGIVHGKKGSRAPVPAIQPTFEEFAGSSFKRQYHKATYPEFLTNDALIRHLNLKPGIDFTYQYNLGQQIMGGLGANIDFVVTNTFPFIGLPVQGAYWHPEYGAKFKYDIAQFQRIELIKGWTCIPLEEMKLLQNAEFVVTQAVRFRRDLSGYKAQLGN